MQRRSRQTQRPPQPRNTARPRPQIPTISCRPHSLPPISLLHHQPSRPRLNSPRPPQSLQRAPCVQFLRGLLPLYLCHHILRTFHSPLPPRHQSRRTLETQNSTRICAPCHWRNRHPRGHPGEQDFAQQPRTLTLAAGEAGRDGHGELSLEGF